MTAGPRGGLPLVPRPYTPADEAALIALWTRSWQETMPGIDFAVRRGFIAGILARTDYETLVAVPDRALGFVTIEPARAYLHQLAVAPEAKGQGIAAALLDAAKRAAPSGLTLDVNQANTRAVRFYEREGFLRADAGVNEASGLATWRMVWGGG